MLSEESKQPKLEQHVLWVLRRIQEVGCAGGDWGGGWIIFGATGEKNHKWLDAKATPPSK